MLFSNQTRSIVEGLLFITNEPLSVQTLSELVGVETGEIVELIADIRQAFEQDFHGITVIEAANGYMLATKPPVKPYIEQLYKPQMSSLSAAGLETLAIIAYRQPITRGEIELLRGVKAVSYTHLDVYKRQQPPTARFSRKKSRATCWFSKPMSK